MDIYVLIALGIVWAIPVYGLIHAMLDDWRPHP